MAPVSNNATLRLFNYQCSLVVLFLLSSSLSAFAGGVSNSNNALSSAGSSVSSANNAANTTDNKQSITFNSGPTPTHTKTTIESTANPVMGGFSGSFSSDYCGATMQGSAGAVGFGFSVGGPKIDSSCVMLRTFERTQQAASSVAQVDPAKAALLREASLEILGLIDPKVRLILEKKGLISVESKITNVQATRSEEALDKNKSSSNTMSSNPIFQGPYDTPKNKADGALEQHESIKAIQEKDLKSDSNESPEPAKAAKTSLLKSSLLLLLLI